MNEKQIRLLAELTEKQDNLRIKIYQLEKERKELEGSNKIRCEELLRKLTNDVMLYEDLKNATNTMHQFD